MRRRGAQRAGTGFTLVELLIAVAVVAILTAIAVPSYRLYVQRGNRTVAKSAMTEILSRQNSFYVDRKHFATTFDKLGLSGSTVYLTRDGAMSSTSTTESIYEIKLAGDAATTTCPATGSASATGFTVVARPINGQASDTRCATMCMGSTGIKSASGTDASNCWTR
jgi:type IV pilus assembly protein PilE